MNLSFIKKIKLASSTRAFTLVETLVSTVINTLVILGPMTVAINASTYARQTKDVMTATYLAQEAAELLHHLQDSIYIKCVADNGVTNTVCAPELIDGEIYETSRETAWRVFKEDYLDSGVSCLEDTNPAGCAFDFIDMTLNEDVAPTKYLPTDPQCNSLYLTADYDYVCSGAHAGGAVNTSFTRSILIHSIAGYTNSYDNAFNDDLRADISVSFRRSNGYTRTIKLADFFHARP